MRNCLLASLSTSKYASSGQQPSQVYFAARKGRCRSCDVTIQLYEFTLTTAYTKQSNDFPFFFFLTSCLIKTGVGLNFKSVACRTIKICKLIPGPQRAAFCSSNSFIVVYTEQKNEDSIIRVQRCCSWPWSLVLKINSLVDWSNFRPRQVECLSWTHSLGVNPYTRDEEIWRQETRKITVSSGSKHISTS